eukprot:TRINITY_DN13153_c0_g1_i1.p1 TRINITY_DN13153_c0_g1~~TRINITY_DN13153_c0_g1_i1.p1  ORF type:complete len:180 (-),score=43.80 TRINITY_DN13153_c0_g1_i1:56-595(-)
MIVFFFQAEDGIRDLVRSRGLGDVYKRQQLHALRGRVEKLRMQDSERTKHQAILQQQQQSTASMPYFSESTTSNMNQSAGSAGRTSLPESYGLQAPGVGESPPGVSLMGSFDSRSVAVVKDAFLRQHQRVQLISTVLRNHPRFQLYCAPYPRLSEIQKRQVLLVPVSYTHLTLPTIYSV